MMTRLHCCLSVPLAALLLAGAAGCGSGDVSSSGSAGTGTSTGTAGAAGSGSGTSTSTSTGVEEHFSFFVTSLAALQQLSGDQAGFGGDLRFGETGPGAGLRGADKICATIADKSMPGAGKKEWRAFLSATADENGKQVDAIDRVGEGPWYDRIGRVFALTKADLLTERPTNIDPAIKDDFPNEDGVPNHAPDPLQGEVDNHDFLTGTGEDGKLYGPTSTCLDWTAKGGITAIEGKPRVGHSWPRYGGPGDMPDGGMMFPQELIDACDGLKVGDACSATLNGMNITGTCGDVNGQTACQPDGFPGGPDGGPPDGGFPDGGFPDGGPGGGFGSGANWMSSLDESGCAPGVNLIEMGGPQPDKTTVGSGGGYGGFYCFALTP